MGSAPRQSKPVQVSPQPIFEAAWSFAVTRALAAAVELDLFSCIDRGSNTIEDLERETGCSTRGLRMLLDAMTGLKYLEKADSRYALAPLAAAYLSKTSPQYLGAYVAHIAELCWSPWAQLSQVIRSGEPVRRVEGAEEGGEFFSQFVDSLYALSTEAAATAAQALAGEEPEKALHVLDVGAGSAVWSLGFAKQRSNVHVTIVDWPEVIERVTRNFVAREGAADRYEYRPGDFRQVEFGESSFDVVILGHICHSEGAAKTQRLIQRSYHALKSGGQILIAELLPNDDRTGPPLPLLFALNMMVLTEEGSAFTLAEYQRWLEDAGFTDVQTIQAPAPSPLITARKP